MTKIHHDWEIFDENLRERIYGHDLPLTFDTRMRLNDNAAIYMRTAVLHVCMPMRYVYLTAMGSSDASMDAGHYF